MYDSTRNASCLAMIAKLLSVVLASGLVKWGKQSAAEAVDRALDASR